MRNHSTKKKISHTAKQLCSRQQQQQQQQHFTGDECAFIHHRVCVCVCTYVRCTQYTRSMCSSEREREYINTNSICVLMSKQFNALFMNIALTLYSSPPTLRWFNPICQNACIHTDTFRFHWYSVHISTKQFSKRLKYYDFFLFLLKCAVSIS